MNQNVQLLTQIYEGSQMGIDAITTLANKTKDSILKTDLDVLADEHRQMASTANQELIRYGGNPTSLGMFTKVQLWTSTQMNTLTNQSPDHLASMLVDGHTMAIKDMTKAIHDYTDADKNVVQLAQQYIDLQQKHIEKMKTYL
ncbi:MAG: hypothetical protein H7Y41_01090 [Hyphomonadaceae bacterium]|nr:hypothetical protein [Clostridia bacterium]